MGIVFLVALTVAVLVLLVSWGRSWRTRAHDGRGASRSEHVPLVKLAALVLVGFGVGFFVLFAVAEMVGGDVAGLQHVPPALVLGGLLWLGWKRPRAAGIVLVAISVPLWALIIGSIATDAIRPGEIWVALPIAIVPVLTGLLFLCAAQGERHRRPGDEARPTARRHGPTDPPGPQVGVKADSS